MQKIVEYQFIHASNTAEIDRLVEAMLDNGWELYSSPMLSQTSVTSGSQTIARTIHAQVVVKREKSIMARVYDKIRSKL